MSDYTPTTEHIRAQYARQENYDAHFEGDLALTPDGIVSAAEFDRWLKAHDAEVAATTLRDVATSLASSFHPSLSDEDTIGTLHVYADEYEKEAGL